MSKLELGKTKNTVSGTPLKQSSAQQDNVRSSKPSSNKPHSKGSKKKKSSNTTKQNVAFNNSMLSKYELCCTLTDSTRKQVILARDLTNSLPVVVKVSSHAAEHDFLQKFKHPHVAQVIEECCTTYGKHVLVMPKYVCYRETLERGSSMQTAIQSVTNKFVQLFDGIAFLHKQGAYYGDISWNNVMFDSKGNVILMDFDLAGFINDIDGPSRFGTGIFVAPELDKQSQYCEKIDVYSCGILVIEWLRYAITLTKSNSVVECLEFFDSLKRGKYHDAQLLQLLAIVQGCIVAQQENRLSSSEVVQLSQLLFKNTASVKPCKELLHHYVAPKAIASITC